uniref:Uncharacterized protein n=1 Tax=Saccharolobus solfataricus (strain 98/2) TaxID=555311 RepID=D0KUL0_SACS9
MKYFVSILEKFLDYDLVVYPLPKAIDFLKALVYKERTLKGSWLKCLL